MAWGEKGHSMSNEAATWGMPAEMPVFFHRAYPQLIYLAYDPDRWRSGPPSLEAANFPDHFIDYEYVATLELPPSRYDFIALLLSSGTLKHYGIRLDTPGFLPWRIAELAETLTVEWRLWLQSRNPADRRQIEENIIFLSGILGHFAADASNPHHTSINFNGWGDANPNGYATDCDAHARFESEFVDHAIEVANVEPRLAAPRLRDNYFAAGLELIRESNSLVEPLYRIDRDGGFSSRRGTAEGREFAVSRLAAGASLIRDLWWSTYHNARLRSERREPASPR
jgi:hypothetical protein